MVKVIRETVPAGNVPSHLGAILDQAPALRQLLRQRMSDFPEYEAFMRQYGTGVLAALDDCRQEQRSVA